MKPYVELQCDNLTNISNSIYLYLQNSTDILTSGAIGWHFLDHKKLFASAPELLEFFSKLKLIPNSASVVILTDTGQLPLHVDELPVVAKINFPIINTEGWSNRWYSVSDEELANCPKKINQFGSRVEMIEAIPKSSFKLIAEIQDLSAPIVFNSRIPHEVVKLNGQSPRIIASFTFHNEPLDYLK